MNANFAQLVPEGRSNIYYAGQQKKFKYRSYKAALFYWSSAAVNVFQGADHQLKFCAQFRREAKYSIYGKNASLYLCVLMRQVYFVARR